MRKLNKTITKEWLKDENSFHALKKEWKEKMQKREKIACKYHLMYKVLIGRDWTSGLTSHADYSFVNLAHSNWALTSALDYFANYINIDKAKYYIPKLVNSFVEPYKEIPNE